MHTYLRNKPAWQQLIIFVGLTVGILFLGFTVGMGIVAQLNHLSVMQIASMGPKDYARPELAGVIRGLLIVQFFAIFFSSFPGICLPGRSTAFGVCRNP